MLVVKNQSGGERIGAIRNAYILAQGSAPVDMFFGPGTIVILDKVI